MKNLLLLITILISVSVSAQVGISTETSNENTELHVVSPNSNTGVLIPNLTNAEMNAIASPTNGLLIFNKDENKFMYNAGNSTTPLWTSVGGIPSVPDIETITNGIKGDVRYCKTKNNMFYWKENEKKWQKISSSPVLP